MLFRSDKLTDATSAFNEILNNMPQSEKAFSIAKESIIADIRTARIIREDILWNYLNNKEFGYDTDPRIALFEKVSSFTLQDIVKFQEQYIKDKPLVYCVLGDLNSLDKKELEKLGRVKVLTQEEIFGY